MFARRSAPPRLAVACVRTLGTVQARSSASKFTPRVPGRGADGTWALALLPLDVLFRIDIKRMPRCAKSGNSTQAFKRALDLVEPVTELSGTCCLKIIREAAKSEVSLASLHACAWRQGSSLEKGALECTAHSNKARLPRQRGCFGVEHWDEIPGWPTSAFGSETEAMVIPEAALRSVHCGSTRANRHLSTCRAWRETMEGAERA